jgi:cytochrome c oxidase assembly protein subunit 15
MAQTHRPRPDNSAPEELSRESHGEAVWPHRLAWATAGATVFLLFVGGLVTSLRVGLAVPDWPTTFGYNMFLFPWSAMVGGVFYEHSHRLVASAVGLLTVLLAVSLWLWERRRWVRWLGAAALLLVVAQGIIGGLRVVLLEVAFAILHACLAQAFFALAVSLALFTSAEWPGPPRWMPRREAVSLRSLCLSAALVIYVQGILGALLRHTGAMLMPHLFVAGLMVGLVSWLSARVWRYRFDHPELWRPGLLLGALVLAQILLGLSSYLSNFWAWPPVPVVVLLTTLHAVTGSVTFATAVVLILRCYRVSAPADFVGAPDSVLASAPGASQRTA